MEDMEYDQETRPWLQDHHQQQQQQHYYAVDAVRYHPTLCTPQGQDREDDVDASLINYDVDLCTEKEKPFGLKLTVNQRLVARINKETSIIMPENFNAQPQEQQVSSRGKKRVCSSSADKRQRLNAVSFPARWLKIGSWQKIAKNEGELTVKCYPRRKRMAWEVLNGNLKQKVEFNLSDVAAIKAAFSSHENHGGELKVLLKNPPSFFQEIDPVPRKHTNWQPCSDFTHGQCSMLRLHTLIINPEVLEKNYEKLLSLDNDYLRNVSRHHPFPTTSSNLYFPQLVSFQHGSMIPSYYNTSLVDDESVMFHSSNDVNDPQQYSRPTLHYHPSLIGQQQYNSSISGLEMNHVAVSNLDDLDNVQPPSVVESSSLQAPISSYLVDPNQSWKGTKAHLPLPVWRPPNLPPSSGGQRFNSDIYDGYLERRNQQTNQDQVVLQQQHYPHLEYFSSDDIVERSNFHRKDDPVNIINDEWLSKFMEDVGPLQLWD